ncbi:glycosyltransferase [Nocardioides sp. Kera G14]|uniref:glycosyltransferase n=1 Tax=Nocardioides sp. Kera G14 TaxID=2884264 RepID=UPI001D125735|nr:glycosyltransferase [Nocardioides sp. Kera G14]UDY23115.1 glycosyltransferase [Nocardioides sp. Kera G14]
MKRVAVFLDPGNGWQGGISYRRNLVSAIYAGAADRITPVCFLPTDASMPSGFPDAEVIRFDPAIFSGLGGLVGKGSRALLGRNIAVERLLSRNGIDVMFHTVAIGTRSSVPTISWIPDFQHVRMPDHFPTEERKKRDGYFKRLVRDSQAIVLSSYSARDDFDRFAPGNAEKARVLRFVSWFGDDIAETEAVTLRNRYDLEGPYFHLPNQFWRHKRHDLVLDALEQMKDRGFNPLVVATGSTADYRNPDYFRSLMARVSAHGLDGNFKALGAVSLSDLVALMRNAQAILNPSDFEGWSTSVEESKSLGIPIVLSDIEVHAEQAPTLGTYFSAGNAASLADKLELLLLQSDDQERRRELRERAERELPERIARFGSEFADIIDSV